jgi:hypothetical protein
MTPKRFSTAIFGIALICFFLPWVNVSCQGQKVATFSGVQLVTGTTVEEPQMFGPAIEKKIPGEFLAILVFLSACAGLALSFIKDKRGATGATVTGGMGIIFLLLLKSKLDNDILRQGQGILQIDYGAGFYLTLLLFLFAIGINIYSIAQGKGISPFQGKDVSGYKFCTQCGAKNESGNEFCKKCGTKFS